MTIAVLWQEDGLQWSAADTRLVAGRNNQPTTEIAAKIYAIPVVLVALDAALKPREPHYRTQYGFVYAGAALPASMTAVTASTFLQKLGHPGDRADPPTFEQIAGLVHRLANRFMAERRQFGGEGIFSAAFFGWCPHAMKYKIAHIDGRNDAGSFRVELFYPPPPETDGEPWLVRQRRSGVQVHTRGIPSYGKSYYQAGSSSRHRQDGGRRAGSDCRRRYIHRRGASARFRTVLRG
jgi:hypothetical protein